MSGNTPILLGALDMRARDQTHRLMNAVRAAACSAMQAAQVTRRGVPVEALLAASLRYPHIDDELQKKSEAIVQAWVRDQLETKLANRMIAMLDAPEPEEPVEVQP